MTTNPEPQADPEPTEWERFKDMAKRLVHVPKDEVKKARDKGKP